MSGQIRISMMSGDGITESPTSGGRSRGLRQRACGNSPTWQQQLSGDPNMLRLYRILLRLYPTAFREEYAKAMEQEFRDEQAEAQTPFTVVWLWMRLLFDLAVSLPVQLAIEIGRDSRHALRLWAKRPWHTGFAVVALGVAIGANTGVFSIVNALLLRSLPFRDPAGLAALIHFLPPHDTAAQFDSWRRNSNYLQDAAL